jgi:uncharacterized membrane protein YadS
MSIDEDMDIARLCALTEQTAKLKPRQRATQAEVRALAREILRLRVALRGARLNAQRVVIECEEALVNAPIGGGDKAL